MTESTDSTPPVMEWSADQMKEALRIVRRHVQGAPKVHFGDTRERSSAIRGSVHRVQHTARLRVELGAINYLCENATLTREEKSDLYDISHELRSEIAARRAGDSQ